MAFKLPSLNQEIWDHVTVYMSSLSTWHAARIFLFKPPPAKNERHGRTWGSIFRNDSWACRIAEKGIRIALVGPQLDALYYNIQSHKPDHSFMVLHCKNWNYNTTMDLDHFFQSLNEHDYDRHAKRVKFADNIVLDIASIFSGSEWHYIEPDPTLLLSWKPTSFESFYLFWDNDNGALHTLGPKSVVGTSGFVREKKHISYIYGLHLTDPSGSKFQVTFCRNDLDDYERVTGREIRKRASEPDFAEGKAIGGWDLVDSRHDNPVHA